MKKYFKKKLRAIRFRIAHKLDKSPQRCWADLAMFGMGNNMLKNITAKCGDACRQESIDHGSKTCWCGKFYNGELARESAELAERMKEYNAPNADPLFI